MVELHLFYTLNLILESIYSNPQFHKFYILFYLLRYHYINSAGPLIPREKEFKTKEKKGKSKTSGPSIPAQAPVGCERPHRRAATRGTHRVQTLHWKETERLPSLKKAVSVVHANWRGFCAGFGFFFWLIGI